MVGLQQTSIPLAALASVNIVPPRPPVALHRATRKAVADLGWEVTMRCGRSVSRSRTSPLLRSTSLSAPAPSLCTKQLPREFDNSANPRPAWPNICVPPQTQTRFVSPTVDP